MKENALVRNLRLASKFLVSQTWKQVIIIDIMSNISRSKDQTMTFGQLIKYNMRNIFLEKSYKQFGGETSSRSLSKKSMLSIFLDQQFNFFYSLFQSMTVEIS